MVNKHRVSVIATAFGRLGIERRAFGGAGSEWLEPASVPDSPGHATQPLPCTHAHFPSATADFFASFLRKL